MAFKYKKINHRGIHIFTAVAGLVLFLLSSSVIPFLSQLKNAPSPDLLLCLVCASGAFLPKKQACIYAVIFGFFADLFLYAPMSFSPVVYLVSVFVTCICLSFFSEIGSITAAVCSVPAILIRIITKSIATAVVFEDAGFFKVLGENLLPEFAVNFASVIVICFICRRLIYKLNTNSLRS